MLYQMLQAREDRAARQQDLLTRFGKPLVCFTMNIPGPVKDSPLIRRSFRWGLQWLDAAVPSPLYREIREEVTGCEGYFAVDLDPPELKRICTRIEDETPVGRLFDMDVLDEGGNKLDRSLVDGKSRDCIVCGAPGRGCASRRIHSVAELTAAANGIMERHFLEEDSRRIAALVTESLLEEVHTTPKPGLVDRRNTGSHRDMDLELFTASAFALEPYFAQCVRIGRETAEKPPEEAFLSLRSAGREAEEIMFRTTGGVNTHKGAIFTLGLLCGSIGRLWTADAPVPDRRDLLDRCAELAACSLKADLEGLTSAKTAGEALYLSRGITGIRGEAAAGLPSVEKIALPAFREALSRGLSRNGAGAAALLHLIARVEDTNLCHRGGAEGAAWAKQEAASLLPCPTEKQLEALDDAFIARNLSPGGCADLLAATYFLDKLTVLACAGGYAPAGNTLRTCTTSPPSALLDSGPR